MNTEYGDPIPKFAKLRKMRVRVPSLNVGKSGGYRLIYRRSIIDEVQYLVLLETYFKGDKEDLTFDEYQQLLTESDTILSNVLDYEWIDGPRFGA